MYTAETRVQSVKSNTNNSTWRWQEQEKQKWSGRMKHASLPGIVLQLLSFSVPVPKRVFVSDNLWQSFTFILNVFSIFWLSGIHRDLSMSRCPYMLAMIAFLPLEMLKLSADTQIKDWLMVVRNNPKLWYQFECWCTHTQVTTLTTVCRNSPIIIK